MSFDLTCRQVVLVNATTWHVPCCEVGNVKAGQDPRPFGVGNAKLEVLGLYPGRLYWNHNSILWGPAAVSAGYRYMHSYLDGRSLSFQVTPSDAPGLPTKATAPPLVFGQRQRSLGHILEPGAPIHGQKSPLTISFTGRF